METGIDYVRLLYEEAVKNGREDYDIRVQYQDGGGCYSGSAYASEVEWDDTMKEVTVAYHPFLLRII